MSNKKMVPEIRFEGFEGEWEDGLVKDIYTITRGEVLATNKTKQVPDSQYRYPVYSSQTKKYGFMGYYDEYLFENAITWTTDGANAGTVSYRKGKFYSTNVNGVLLNSDGFVNKAMAENINNIAWKHVVRAGNPKLMNNIMGNIRIKYPSLEEQKEISKFLLNIDENIRNKQAELEKLKQFKQAMLQKMFPKEGETVPEVRFEGFEEKWEQRNLGRSGYTFTGISGKSKEDFGHGEARYIPYTNVFNNPITDLEDLEKIEIDRMQNEVQYGDVFFTTSSETPEEVGMASVWKHNGKNVYLNSFCFGYRPTEEFDLDFLAYLLHSPLIRGQFQILAQGISRFNISKTKAMNIEFLVPTIKEQKEIGKYFINLQKNIDSKQSELDKLKQFKQAMLDKMFV